MLFKERSIYQYRLGTDTGKAEKRGVFSAGALSLDDGETFRGGLEVFTDPHEQTPPLSESGDYGAAYPCLLSANALETEEL
jgi:hypothetical protein